MKKYILFVFAFLFTVQLQSQITTPVQPDISNGRWPMLLLLIVAFVLYCWKNFLKKLEG